MSELRAVNERSRAPDDDQRAVEDLSRAIVNYAGAHPTATLLLDIDGPAWTIAAGVVVELQKAHVPFAVTEDAVWMFSDIVAPRGDETSTIAISAADHHQLLAEKPSTVTIGERSGYFADV